MFGKSRAANGQLSFDQVNPDRQGIVNESMQGEADKKEISHNGKKRFRYLAVDKKGEVLLNSEGNPYFITVEEGSSADWPKEIQNEAQIDTTLRIELAEPEKSLGKDEKKKEKEAIRKKADEELSKIAADKIKSDRERKNSDGERISIHQKVPEVKSDFVKNMREELKINDAMVCNEDDCSAETMDKNLQYESTHDLLQKNVSSLDISLLIDAIYAAEKRLNRDVNDLTDAIQDSLEESEKKNSVIVNESLEKHFSLLNRNARRYVEDIKYFMEQTVQKNMENGIRKANGIIHNFEGKQDEILLKYVSVEKQLGKLEKSVQDDVIPQMTSVSFLGKRVKELGESIESMEGDLHKLNQLDSIVELLHNKGLNISMEIPPVNAEEEDIVNLVRYSQKITEQLGYAARELLRKQRAFRSLDQSNANEQKMIEQKMANAKIEGVQEGQRKIIRQLISKYDDIDIIREADNNYVHVIWTLFMELGVEIDGNGQFVKGREVTLSEEEVQRMLAVYSKLDGSGNYRVTRTGLRFAGEIVSKAEFEKVLDK